MDKGKYIEEIKPGERFPHSIFAVKSFESKKDKNGNSFASFKLSDQTGERDAKLWKLTEAQAVMLRSARLITVSGEFSLPKGDFPSQMMIDTVDIFKASPDEESDFLAPLPRDHQKTIERYNALRASVRNNHLKQLLDKVFTDERFRQFENAVAASDMHHSYRGGLLLHSVEVAELCQRATRTLSFLRHDLLVASALVHDIGKLWEMRHGLRAGEYTEMGLLEGHVVTGAFFVGRLMGEIEGFPQGLSMAVRHLILSHHDRMDFGSPKTPALPEAIVLAHCDSISAHASDCWDCYEAERGTGQVRKKRMDRTYCVADLKLDSINLSGNFSDPLPDNIALLMLRGLVAAGDADTTAGSQDMDEQIMVTLPPSGADYLVNVTGDSMVDAGILPGDRVFVRYQETANPNDIVIAHITASGEVIKRYIRTAEGEFLHSENPDQEVHPPIPVTAETVKIQGVVTRVERDLIRR